MFLDFVVSACILDKTVQDALTSTFPIHAEFGKAPSSAKAQSCRLADVLELMQHGIKISKSRVKTAVVHDREAVAVSSICTTGPTDPDRDSGVLSRVSISLMLRVTATTVHRPKMQLAEYAHMNTFGTIDAAFWISSPDTQSAINSTA